MKGTIEPDHIPVNRYQLIVAGFPAQLNPTEISGMEEEIGKVELPDKTVASGGRPGPSEFTMAIPAHHDLEIAACEAWFAEGQEPVSPTYKKAAILLMRSLTGNKFRVRTIIGAWISKRTDPDLEQENDGDMATIEYTVSVDRILPG